MIALVGSMKKLTHGKKKREIKGHICREMWQCRMQRFSLDCFYSLGEVGSTVTIKESERGRQC